MANLSSFNNFNQPKYPFNQKSVRLYTQIINGMTWEDTQPSRIGLRKGSRFERGNRPAADKGYSERQTQQRASASVNPDPAQEFEFGEGFSPMDAGWDGFEELHTPPQASDLNALSPSNSASARSFSASLQTSVQTPAPSSWREEVGLPPAGFDHELQVSDEREWEEDFDIDWDEDADIAELARTWLEEDVPLEAAEQRAQAESALTFDAPAPEMRQIKEATAFPAYHEPDTADRRQAEAPSSRAQVKEQEMSMNGYGAAEPSYNDFRGFAEGSYQAEDALRRTSVSSHARQVEGIDCPHCHDSLLPTCYEVPYMEDTIVIVMCSNCRKIVGTTLRAKQESAFERISGRVLQALSGWLQGS